MEHEVDIREDLFELIFKTFEDELNRLSVAEGRELWTPYLDEYLISRAWEAAENILHCIPLQPRTPDAPAAIIADEVRTTLIQEGTPEGLAEGLGRTVSFKISEAYAAA